MDQKIPEVNVVLPRNLSRTSFEILREAAGSSLDSGPGSNEGAAGK